MSDAPPKAAVGRLAAVCADPERVDALIEELVEITGVANAAQARMAAIAAELDDLCGGHPVGCRSTGQLLSWQAGLNPSSAAKTLQVGRAMAALPALAEAVLAGQVSPDQARSIAGAATDDREAAELVGFARSSTTNQLEQVCRTLVRGRKTDDGGHRHRKLTTGWTAHGTLRVRAELAADDGSDFLNALARAKQQLSGTDEERLTDTDDPAGAGDADALGLIGRDWLAADDAAGDDETDVESPRGGRRCRPRLIVHVDLDTLAGAETDGGRSEEPDPGRTTDPYPDEDTSWPPPAGRVCRFGWTGVSIPTAMARQWACDPLLQVVLRDPDGNPLALGRTRHAIPRKLRRHVLHRDQGCVLATCRAKRDIHVHHIRHWTNGGVTDPDNLACLCHLHHRLLHAHHLRLARDANGDWYLATAAGAHWQPPRRHAALTPDAAAAAYGIAPRQGAAQNRWDGGHLHADQLLTGPPIPWSPESDRLPVNPDHGIENDPDDLPPPGHRRIHLDDDSWMDIPMHDDDREDREALFAVGA